MDYQPSRYIHRQAKQMQTQLCEWVALNTGSSNIAGLQGFALLLQDALLPLADVVSLVDLAPFATLDTKGQWQQQAVGSAVLAYKRPQAPIQIYLGGHYDTVFPVDSHFQQPNWLSPDRLGGPGILDMKSGLLIMLAALAAFEHSPLAKRVGWRVLINPDEEIGSVASASLISEQAKLCNWGMIYEPALDIKGTWAGARGGSAKYILVVRGKSAHVGRAFTEGRNAIVKCATYLTQLAALNADFPKAAINIGKMHGGESVNQVPALAMAYIDVRAPSQADLSAIEQAMISVLINDDVDYQVTLESMGKRSPKILEAKQMALLHFSKAYLGLHGFTVDWQDTGGCSDGNQLSACGLANIDTLGGCGGLIHTDQEWLAVPSLVERAELSAWLLQGLAESDLQRG